jgi:hypothetical protein
LARAAKSRQIKEEKILWIVWITLRNEGSPKGQRVRIMGVIDGRESGTLFFDAQSDRFLGAVVVAMSEHAKTYFDGTLNNGPFRPGAELAKTA